MNVRFIMVNLQSDCEFYLFNIRRIIQYIIVMLEKFTWSKSWLNAVIGKLNTRIILVLIRSCSTFVSLTGNEN